MHLRGASDVFTAPVERFFCPVKRNKTAVQTGGLLLRVDAHISTLSRLPSASRLEAFIIPAAFREAEARRMASPLVSNPLNAQRLRGHAFSLGRCRGILVCTRGIRYTLLKVAPHSPSSKSLCRINGLRSFGTPVIEIRFPLSSVCLLGFSPIMSFKP